MTSIAVKLLTASKEFIFSYIFKINIIYGKQTHVLLNINRGKLDHSIKANFKMDLGLIGFH